VSEAPAPRVSVGLPVFNGEPYLAAAIDSILGQSWADLELIICDNASTDGTRQICEAAAARDPRVRYHRNPQNLGAAPNYRRTLELARGELFKWAAHDDLIRPSFIAACMAVFDADPGAVLCMPGTVVIDDQGRERMAYDSGLVDAGHDDPARRFAALILNRHWCTEIFGLIRTEALRLAKPYRPYNASDRVLLAELALIGRFRRLDEPLFLNRDHAGRYSRAVYPDVKKALAWNESGRGGFFLQTWTVLGAYAEMIGRLVPDGRTRLRCRVVLGRWLLAHWNWLRLLLDPLRAIDPRIFALASRVKRGLFGGTRKAAYDAPERSDLGAARPRAD
jgi:glycosyltransferase involved in cell wall biosynthesis